MLAKVDPSVADRVLAEPDAVERIWPEDGVVDADLGIDPEGDRFEEDFLYLGRFLAGEEDTGGRDVTWLTRASQGTGTEVAHEFGYGAGFVVPAAEVPEVAEGLVAEGWSGGREDGETVAHALVDFYAAAAREGKAVVGGVA